jgi:protein SCO1
MPSSAIEPAAPAKRRMFAALERVALTIAAACLLAASVHIPRVDTRSGPRIPNVALITHEGKLVRFNDDLLKNKIVLINFTFTSCQNYCPITMPILAKVQGLLGERMGRDMFIYSITLDPEFDTPAVLAQQASALGAGRGWKFLTGDPAAVHLLRRRLGVYDSDPSVDADRTQHIGMLVLGHGGNDRWATISALLKPEQIARAVVRMSE